MSILFIDNPIVAAKPDAYQIIAVNTQKTLQSWKQSLFSFEWLNPDGTIRAENEMPETVQAAYQEIQKNIKTGGALKRPVLGVGLMDNVEIGSAKDVFLTLAASHVPSIDVHISIKDQDFFRKYKA